MKYCKGVNYTDRIYSIKLRTRIYSQFIFSWIRTPLWIRHLVLVFLFVRRSSSGLYWSLFQIWITQLEQNFMQEKNCLTLVKKLLRDWYNAVFRLGHETHNVFEKKNLKGKIFLLWHKSQVFKSHANISFVYLKFRALKKTISQSEIQNGSIITENYSTLQICILFFVY